MLNSHCKDRERASERASEREIGCEGGLSFFFFNETELLPSSGLEIY